MMSRRCTLSDYSITRCALPQTLLYFLIQVLQRMLHQFWDTAQQNAYVLRCGRANGRCPTSIIAVLFYYECKELSPCMSGKTPRTKKQRLEAGSEAVASSGDAAPPKGPRNEASPRTWVSATCTQPAGRHMHMRHGEYGGSRY